MCVMSNEMLTVLILALFGVAVFFAVRRRNQARKRKETKSVKGGRPNMDNPPDQQLQ